MPSPSSSFKKSSPQQIPSPMPSTNCKKCLRLSTFILFTSTSLRFPHSKSSMSSLYTSFLSMVQISKSVSSLSNFCATISSTSTFQGLQQPAFNALHFGYTGLTYSVVEASHPSTQNMHLLNLLNHLAVQYTGKRPTLRNI